jgi:predicted transcriptional regulator
MLEKLFGSKSAYWVLLFIYHYGEVYPAMIAENLETSANPIKGQLKKLSNVGILLRKKTGNVTIYFFNEKAAIVKPLKEMLKIEYDNISSADKNKIFKLRARSRREGKPVIR